MRKIILDLAVTLDGFIEGPNGEIDWCIMEDDMGFDGFLRGIDTIFFGRVSYEMWRQSSPDANADPSIEFLNRIIRQKKKYVFSRTMKKDDESVSIVDSDMENKVREIKTQPGRDIWLYGGANLITSFANLGLIDVYRLAVHPVVLGDGKPLFTDIKKRINLKQPRPPLTNQVWCSWFLKPNDPALAKAWLPL
jgi:dihydrofolate reductase